MPTDQSLLEAVAISAFLEQQAREQLSRDFDACIAAEISYAQIARAMGVTKQAARERALKLWLRGKSGEQKRQ